MVSFAEVVNRITVADILCDHGIEVRGNRITCPIHGGNNPTSFSFNESTSNCFSCGAKGGLIDLVQLLRGCDRKVALAYLEGKTGIQLTRETVYSPPAPLKRKCIERSPKRDILRSYLFGVDALRDAYTRLIRMWSRAVRQGEAPLGQFYANVQYFEYELEHWDAGAIRLTHEMHSLGKGVN